MRRCIIYNPAARGEKAARNRKFFESLSDRFDLIPTTGPGAARALACEAAGDGFDAIVAAGGDGTVNEVINGIRDAGQPGLEISLGILPTGTMNVFARDVLRSCSISRAVAIIESGRTRRIDLPYADTVAGRRYFAQLGGVGLDARAVNAVSWMLKKKIGWLAYVVAVFEALRTPPARLELILNGKSHPAETIFVGNGMLYGGPFQLFPHSLLDDGKLDFCFLRNVNVMSLSRLIVAILSRHRLPSSAQYEVASSARIISEREVPMQLDGESAGVSPVEFGVLPKGLKVFAPDPV